MKKISLVGAVGAALVSLFFLGCDAGGEDFFLDPVEDAVCNLSGGVTLTTNGIIRTGTNGKPQVYITGQDTGTGFISAVRVIVEPAANVQAFPLVQAGAQPVVIDLASANGNVGLGGAVSQYRVTGSLTSPNGTAFDQVIGGTLTIQEAHDFTFIGSLTNVTFQRQLQGTAGGVGLGTGTGQGQFQTCPLAIDSLPINLTLRLQNTPPTNPTRPTTQTHTPTLRQGCTTTSCKKQ
jgi:hypothetical protein